MYTTAVNGMYLGATGVLCSVVSASTMMETIMLSPHDEYKQNISSLHSSTVSQNLPECRIGYVSTSLTITEYVIVGN